MQIPHHFFPYAKIPPMTNDSTDVMLQAVLTAVGALTAEVRALRADVAALGRLDPQDRRSVSVDGVRALVDQLTTGPVPRTDLVRLHGLATVNAAVATVPGVVETYIDQTPHLALPDDQGRTPGHRTPITEDLYRFFADRPGQVITYTELREQFSKNRLTAALGELVDDGHLIRGTLSTKGRPRTLYSFAPSAGEALPTWHEGQKITWQAPAAR